MNRRRLLTIIAAVVLTLLGTVILIAYVNSAERRAQEGAELVRVLYAVGEIEAGTPASELVGSELVAVREVPATVRPDDAVMNPEELGEEEAVNTIHADTPIIARQFDTPQATGGGARGGVREGREVISVALETQRALGGDIQEDDHVGMMMSIEGAQPPPGSDTTNDNSCGGTTAMVLAGLTVVDVNGINAETGEAGNTITVSFDVDQSQAEKIAFAAEYGRIWLTRQPENPSAANVGVQDCGSILDPTG